MTTQNQTAATIDQTTGQVIRYRVRNGWTRNGQLWTVDTESEKYRTREATIRALCTEDTADLSDWMGDADPYTLSPRTIARQYDEQVRDWKREDGEN